jgi:ribonucleoside-diphosphate reductase alpha chain
MYGEDFDKLYMKYVEEGKYRKKIPAQQLWLSIIKAQIETGTPYILYKDAVNKKSNQKNLGTIKSSNLCVAPETKILTDKGYVTIKDVCDEEVNVWNGSEFSKVTVRQTGRMQKLVTIGFSNGMKLRCTPYHKFYIETGSRPADKSVEKVVEAKNLQVGMNVIRYSTPTINTSTETMKSPYTHGLFCAEGTYLTHNWKNSGKRCTYRKWSGTDFCKRHQRNAVTLGLNDEICNAKCCEPVPLIFLYGGKKELLPHIDHEYAHDEDVNDRLSVRLSNAIAEKYFVPQNCTIDTKLRWFEGYVDGDGCVLRNGSIITLQFSSINYDFIMNIAYMLQTMGINSKVSLMRGAKTTMMPNHKGGSQEYECKPIYRVTLDTRSVYHLKTLGFSPKRININDVQKPEFKSKSQFVKICKIEDNDEYDDTYCFNEPLKHRGVFNGVLTGNCSEITEFSDDKDYASCNLASLSLPAFVRSAKNDDGTDNYWYDFEGLQQVAQIVCRNLNKVIDNTFYPVVETEVTNKKHRPLGIGVTGLADVFAMMRLPFDSSEAAKLNVEIFEAIYYGAATASMLIAKRRTEMRDELDTATDDRRAEILKYLNMIQEEERLTEYRGAYCSFKGSPAEEGVLQFDLWGHVPSDRWDWQSLKENVKKYGLRNSLLTTCMPSASTSQIIGNNESIEPFTSNAYVRETLAGNFYIINRYLVNDLLRLGIWDEALKNKILAGNGSIQHIPEIPDDIKSLYKTSFELKQKVLIDQSADRGPYICQSQSLNLFMEDPDYVRVSNAHFYGWRRGLKTGSYYLRSRTKAKMTAYTLEATAPPSAQPSAPAVCRRDDPSCLACSA